MLEKEPFLRPLGPLEQKILDFVEPIVVSQGYELVNLQVTGGRGKPQLTLFVDLASLDQLADLSRLVSNALDVGNAKSNWFSGAYQLELSSPGLDKPLTKKSHFIKAVGQLIRIKTSQGTFKGVLQKADEEGLLLESHEGLLNWSQVLNANIVFIWRK